MGDSTSANFNFPVPPVVTGRPGPCWCNNEQTTGGHYHEQRGGMADRVHIKRDGTTYNAGLSFVWPVCDICGAVVADDALHDRFHAGVSDE